MADSTVDLQPWQDTRDGVVQQLNENSSSANDWAERASEALNAVPPGDAPVPPDIPVDPVSKPAGMAFTKPAIPVKPSLDFNGPQTPNELDARGVESFRDPTATPTEPSSAMPVTYEPGGKPDLDYGTAPTVVVPEVAQPPEITAPDPITLTQSVPPTAPTWGGVDTNLTINPASLPTLANHFDYSEDPYSPAILDLVVTEVQEILAGRMAIPQAIWDAIWSRAAGEIHRQALAEDFEARYEHAALGHTLPGITLLARQKIAGNKASEAINKLTSDSAAKQAELQQQDIWKAIESGLNASTALLGAYSQRQERLLKSAVETNNAALAVFKAALEAYQITEIAAKDLLIKLKDLELRGDLAEFQAFEAEIKAAGFLLEFDKNQVELYKAQWGGEETKARAYAAYQDAIKSYVEAQKAGVESYGISVKANNDQLQGWLMEWDAYVKRFEPYRVHAQLRQADNQLFGTRVSKYQAYSQNELSRFNADIEEEKLKLSQHQQAIALYQAEWQQIIAEADARTKIYATDGQVFSAHGQIESGRIQGLIGEYGADIQKAMQVLQGRIETAKTALGYWTGNVNATVEWQKAQASVAAQIASSFASTANVSLGASQSDGTTQTKTIGYSRGYDVNVSVPIDEASGVNLSPPI